METGLSTGRRHHGRRARASREGVLVLGTSQWSGQPTARSLARAGFNVVGAWEGGRFAGRTRYCRETHHLPPSSDTTRFVAAVAELCRRHQIAVVVPLADEMLATLLRYPEPSAAWKVVGPDYETFLRLCDKSRLLATAAAAGVASPRSTVITSAGPEGELPPFPAYVKVVDGMDEGRPAGRPVRVTDQRSFEQAVRRHTAIGDAALVQEEVVGEQWRFHFVRHRGRTAHLAARTFANSPFRVGQSTVSQFTSSPAALVEVSSKLLDEVGYEGVGVIQFVERDGTWLVHDVNLRMPSSVGGTVVAGLDMPRLAVELALGEEPAIEPVVVRRLRTVQLPGEVDALRDAITGRSDGRSVGAILGGMAKAALLPGQRLTPFDLTDPLPTLVALARIRPSVNRGAPRVRRVPDPAAS